MPLDEPEITPENFDALAQYYDRLIHAVVFEIYKNVKRVVERDDLYQESLITLLKCIENYDPSRGVYFHIYLRRALTNSLLMYCREWIPGHYIKDPDNEGKFKRKIVYVDSFQQKFESWQSDL